MKGRFKLILLYIFSFAVSCGPLVAVFAVKWGEYVKTPSDAVKLSFGALVALFFVLLKILGRLNMPKGAGLYTLVFLLSWLLEPLLYDLKLLAGAALLGECVDFIFIRSMIKRYKEKLFVDKNAEATEALLKKYVGEAKK